MVINGRKILEQVNDIIETMGSGEPTLDRQKSLNTKT